MKKLVLVLSLVLFVGVLSAGCSAGVTSMVDYESAEAFEAAINNGEGVEGKYVKVEVVAFEPASAFGFNIQAGEHLNFVDAENPTAEVGDQVVFKVEKVASMFGSYIITYTEHQVIPAQ